MGRSKAGVERLGHIKQPERIIEQGPSYYRVSGLKHLGGFDVKWSSKDSRAES